MALKALVLAAGAGTRMKSSAPKVLLDLAGSTLLQWVLDSIASIALDETVVVVGHQAAEVEKGSSPGRRLTRLQEQQLGTGDAVRAGLAGMEIGRSSILVLPGTCPC